MYMKQSFFERLTGIFSRKLGETDQTYLDNILNEYKRKRPDYEEFRIVVLNTLESLLNEGNYKYQISSRTKTLERLREKIIRKKQDEKYYYSLGEVEDLVGIRVIFYTERDKEKFVEEIKEEITGYIKTETREKENGYNAIHMIASFGHERLKLSEYKRYRGLKCEIQITSIFHHAWAEIEHDLIYKDIHGLKERDPEKFILIKQKMNHLLENNIKKATKELEEIIDIITK